MKNLETHWYNMNSIQILQDGGGTLFYRALEVERSLFTQLLSVPTDLSNSIK